MIIIMSFPRSGNHLTRFLIEYMTGQATMGCLGAPEDVPIYKNVFEQNPDVLSHVCEPAIGYKTHSIEPVRKLVQTFNCERLLFIERDPVEALLAHQELPKYPLLERGFRNNLKPDIEVYVRLKKFYERADLPKCKIVYENLISPESSVYLGELEKIADICTPHVDERRLADLQTDFKTFRTICSQGKGRSWNGYRSKSRPDFYKHRIDRWTLWWLERRVARRLAAS